MSRRSDRIIPERIYTALPLIMHWLALRPRELPPFQPELHGLMQAGFKWRWPE